MSALLSLVRERTSSSIVDIAPCGEAVDYMVTRDRRVVVSAMLVRAVARTW